MKRTCYLSSASQSSSSTLWSSQPLLALDGGSDWTRTAAEALSLQTLGSCRDNYAPKIDELNRQLGRVLRKRNKNDR